MQFQLKSTYSSFRQSTNKFIILFNYFNGKLQLERLIYFILFTDRSIKS